jgi:hypothetical protein
MGTAPELASLRVTSLIGEEVSTFRARAVISHYQKLNERLREPSD